MILAADPAAGDTQLIFAAILGIAAVVLFITVLKVHPFLSLILGSAVLGTIAGLAPDKTIDAFTGGVGDTVGSVGLLIALGAMIGGLLADTGGADQIVETVVNKVEKNRLPWAMAGVAALVGLPLFFEVGVVLLVPIVLLVARRTQIPVLLLGIPALAGLSVLHGLVPPHPGPLVAIDALNADLGQTLAFGLIVAVPTVIIAGPVFAAFLGRYLDLDTGSPLVLSPAMAGAGGARDQAPPPAGGSGSRGTSTVAGGGGTDSDVDTIDSADADGTVGSGERVDGDDTDRPGPGRRPAFVPTVLTVLLPVVLMLLRAIGEVFLDKDSSLRTGLDIVGTPIVALLAGLILAMFTLGLQAGFSRGRISSSVGGSLGPIAGILLIVAAGGGFKNTLVEAGVGDVVANAAKDANLSTLVLGWLVAVGIRVATGSATVATITASGIVAPLASDLDKPEVALLALAIGAGSLFFSHVNDAGFWLVKEYFGLTVGQTLKSWSVMETIISVVGLLGVLALNVVV